MLRLNIQHASMSFIHLAHFAAPSGPPTLFHVTVLDCNSTRAEWDLPLPQNRNGLIRGFKVFVQPSEGGEEMEFIVIGNTTTELIVEGLTPSTGYVFSVLAFTVGDGPRTIHLTVETNSMDLCESVSIISDRTKAYSCMIWVYATFAVRDLAT